MLARRFTIVCLTMAIFGMMLSSLVAQTGRRDRWPGPNMSIPCDLISDARCAR